MLAGECNLVERCVSHVPVFNVAQYVLGFLVVQGRHITAEAVRQVYQVGGFAVRSIVNRLVVIAGAIYQQLRQTPVIHQCFAHGSVGNTNLAQLGS